MKLRNVYWGSPGQDRTLSSGIKSPLGNALTSLAPKFSLSVYPFSKYLQQEAERRTNCSLMVYKQSTAVVESLRVYI